MIPASPGRAKPADWAIIRRSFRQESPKHMTSAPGTLDLPAGVRSRCVENGNGLLMHMLECGFEDAGRPCVLLLHGFPELAFSWRKIMPALARAGFHVVAPDQRGYGGTTGWDGNYDGDVAAFHLLNLAQDAL